MREPVHILLLGAGVQSSTVALMASQKLIPNSDKIIAAVFADTGDEPESVYRWLKWLEPRLAFPVYRVSKGHLSEETLKIRTSKKNERKYLARGIPAFVKDKSGGQGMLLRTCTRDFKIRPLRSKIKQLAKIHCAQKHIGVIQWFGISYDEVSRMRKSEEPWAENYYPLIDLKMTREDCLRWMKSNKYPPPPRSSCIFCPYHNDEEWQRLKEYEPHEFAKAVQFEKKMQDLTVSEGALDGTPWLTRYSQPLDSIDFEQKTAEKKQASQFNNECDGICGF